MHITHDLHVHTYLSSCCSDKAHQIPREILRIAEEMGTTTIGFSDHLWMNPDVAPSDWYRPQDATQVARLRADLAQIDTPVRTMVGCEADMRAPGAFSITPAFAESLDHVLLACSHFHMRDFVVQPASHAPRDVAEHLLAFCASGVTSGLPTSIAHPFVPLGHIEDLDAIVASISDAEFTDVFGLAAEHGVALEITVDYLPPAPGTGSASFSVETPLRLLTLAKAAGCTFTFGSDAHSPARLRDLPRLAFFAGALGLTEADLHPVVRG